MEKRCDLHVHSSYSDGTLTPEEIVELAVEKHVDVLALTDHNTVRGDKEFLEEAKKQGIIGVAGIEISTEWRGKEVHLLGLFLPESSFDVVEKRMAEELQKKKEKHIQLAENLTKAGMPISYDTLVSQNPGSLINRAHFATALMEKGYVSTVKEAFDRFLKPECGYYQSPEKPGTWEMVSFVRELHGVPVVAHPMISLEKSEIPEFVKEAAETGVAAMETLYSEYSNSQKDYIMHMVHQAGLLDSGGSDFHGSRKPNISLGSGLGRLKVPYTVYENLVRWKEENVMSI